MTTHTIGGIQITALHDGAAVQFQKEKDLNDSLKATFPKARWGAETKSWHIPGKLAVSRALRWAEERQAERAAQEQAAEQARRDAEFEGRPAPAAPLEGLAYFQALRADGRKISTQNVKFIPGNKNIRADVVFAYDPEAVRLIKTIPGAKFDGYHKTWSIPMDQAHALHAIIGAMDQAVAAQLASRNAERRAEQAARDAKAAERRANRYPVLEWDAPAVGSVAMLHGRAVLVEGLGDVWRLDGGDYDGIYPPHLWDRRVRYVYFREATQAEAEAFLLRERERVEAEAQEERDRHERNVRERLETIARQNAEAEEREKALADRWSTVPDGPVITVTLQRGRNDPVELPIAIPQPPPSDRGEVAKIDEVISYIRWTPEPAVVAGIGSDAPIIASAKRETIDGREVWSTNVRGKDGRIVKLALASRPELETLISYAEEIMRRVQAAAAAYYSKEEADQLARAQAQVPEGRVLAQFIGCIDDGWVAQYRLPDGRVVTTLIDPLPIQTADTMVGQTPWYATLPIPETLTEEAVAPHAGRRRPVRVALRDLGAPGFGPDDPATDLREAAADGGLSSEP
ncbi:hypothetical protein [Methylobacterium sp. ID0610]|uniref:hypothetical protein n=1 Tax=Methylobacterium carpenticola TaxID=3344827 RepID=UPI003686F3B0